MFLNALFKQLLLVRRRLPCFWYQIRLPAGHLHFKVPPKTQLLASPKDLYPTHVLFDASLQV